MRRRLFALAACPLAIAAVAVFASESTAAAPRGTSKAAATATAKAVIAPYVGVPTTLGGVTQNLKRLPKKNTRVDYLEIPAPIGQEIGDGMSRAAAALGIKLTTINAGESPQTLQSAWSQVFQTPPAAVIILALPASEMTAELQEAKSKHIQVITLFTANSPLTYDIYGNKQFKLLGKLEASFVIAKSGASANVAEFYEPELSGATLTSAVIQSTFTAHCPGCSFATQQLQLSGTGTTDPATVVSYLQAHPKTTWLIMADAGDAIGLPAALAQAGIHGVKILTGGGGAVNYAYIKAGEQYADASESPQYMGWAMIDATARVLAGQRLQFSFIPLQFITAKAITWNIKNPWPSVPNYERKFERLWGLR
jgi:ABC-type sugar transport system substrate-binding protein